MKQHRSNPTFRRNQGFSLIATLVLLVIATLLGIAAAQLVLVSERSSRYDRDRLIAFQAAEAALLDAEIDIRGPGSSRSGIFSPTASIGFEEGCSSNSNTRGMCLPASPNAPPLWSTVSFTDTQRTVQIGDYTNRPYAAGVDGMRPQRAPRYLIELIPDPTPGGNEGVPRNLYRVTAVGFGPRQDTQVMLQMFFRKE